MLKAKRDYPAGSLLIAVVLASLAPVLIVSSFLLYHYVSMERENALHRVATLADSISATIDRELQSRFETLKALAASRYLREGDLAQFAEVTKAAAWVAPGDFVVFDRSGQQLINTRAELGESLSARGHGDALRQVFEHNDYYVSDLNDDATRKGFYFMLLLPVMVNGVTKYAFGYIPRASKIQTVIDESTLPDDWFAAVLDRKGRIMARSSRHEEFIGKLASSAFIARLVGPSGRVDSVDLEARPTVTTYRRSPLSQWNTIVWVPKSTLERRATLAFAALGALTLATLLVSLLTGYLVARLIRKPTRRLLSAAQALGKGQIVTFDRTWMREANVIGEALADASQDIQLYMRELSHRSKNLLAVVQSISRQTQRSAADLPAFGRCFDERLQSLARSHDLLVERNWNGASLRELVTTQLASFLAPGDARVELHGEPFLLSPAASQHLGLAFHELATNASKYGALSVPDGKVRISWTTDLDAEGTPRFRISWEEQGGPPVRQPERRGFGMFVIEEAVSRGLSGKAKIEWRTDGMTWSLRAPTSGLMGTQRALA